ncbi:hypothetical protein [Pseudomonas sp. OF001]|uniref:hypothetical protein n=1 Tax=Pseudomonas sp. OF001 TaxID=2772300 RepID=UPI001F36A973|nr:hypothetical protein [Pseudomonas sp. OF001]
MRHRVEVLSLSADLAPVSHGSRWASIRAKEAADAPAATGLRSPAMIEVRARYSAELIQGRYLRSGPRLLHITGARDPLGTGAELVLSCHELIGLPGEHRPLDGAPAACRAHLTHNAPYLDDMGQVTDYRTRAEVALLEIGRPQVDDQLLVAGTLYTITGYADETDDGVVRGLWLEAS